jgi:hypothetical protein
LEDIIMVTTPFELSNGGQLWNLNVDGAGRLDFRANSGTGGSTRMTIDDDNGGRVGVGTESPATKVHVVGDRIRLENGSKRLDLRADGGAVDLQTTTDDLFIRSTGAGHHVFINPFPDDGRVGIGTQSPSQKLHVQGNICATGTIGQCSDLRYKTAIEPLGDALTKVMAIRGTRFQWQRDRFPDMDFSAEPQIGLIGQEVEAVFPEAVLTDDDGYKYVDYARLTPVLVEAVKEQQGLIEEQRATLNEAIDLIDELRATLRELKA